MRPRGAALGREYLDLEADSLATRVATRKFRDIDGRSMLRARRVPFGARHRRLFAAGDSQRTARPGRWPSPADLRRAEVAPRKPAASAVVSRHQLMPRRRQTEQVQTYPLSAAVYRLPAAEGRPAGDR